MRRLVASFALPLFALACTEAPPTDLTLDDRAVPPAAAPGSVELRQPEMVVEAGQDLQWCWVPDFVPTEDMLIKRSLGFQGRSGHHMAIFSSVVPRQPGEQYDCTNIEAMTTVSPLIVPDLPNVTEDRILPPGMAVRIPAGSVIVVQSHVINANVEPIRISDVIQLEPVGADESITEASYWVLTDNSLNLPLGLSSVSKDCLVTERTQLVYLLGHMHEWGKSITVSVERAGSVVEDVYSVTEWTAEFRDNGPTVAFTPEAPLVLEAGDTVRVECDYNNDTSAPLTWPHEMCVAFGAYFPSRGEGFIVCGDE